ncbi:MAG: hypothetical protein JKY13_03385 [Gammaproteobacteria bacterium]|nr:hypothetical protein [Gammaproteobacteria bacterium]
MLFIYLHYVIGTAIVASAADVSIARVLTKLNRFPLLILDDIGDKTYAQVHTQANP